MRASSSSAVMVSLTLHGLVAALIFLTTVYVAQQQKTPPVIFELVAGPPTAPEQTKAPALGNNDMILNVPKVDVPKAKPQPVPEVVKPTEMTKPAETKPKAETSIAKEMKKKERMSYNDYKRTHPDPKPIPPAVAKAPRIDAEGIANGVRGGSTANKKGGGGGKALTREEGEAMQVYEAALKNRLEAAFLTTKPAGLSDTLSAEVEFFVSATGEISDVQISRSSGNRDFDQSVLEAFKKITWPSARPDHKTDQWLLTFRMKESD